MGLEEYLSEIAEHIVSELQPILKIKAVTANTDLLGKYTEAAIRNLVIRIVQPMRVSTGAVLDYPLGNPLRQIDLIIWAPFPAPALFDVEGFGLVPKSSAFGVIEIKRSNYKGVDQKFEEFIADVRACRIVAEPRATIQDFSGSPGIGIICILDKKPTGKLNTLIQKKEVLAIFEKKGGKIIVRPKDVLELINFLHFITWRYRVQGSQPVPLKINTNNL